jgi:recombinational DNA repair protein RecT
VCEADEFDYWTDDVGEHLLHKPAILADDRGALVAVYSIGKHKDGGTPKIEVMTRKQVEQVRSFSKAKDSGPWVHWYDEMARKSVIHRMSKYIATTPEIERLIARDHELYDLEQRATKQITGQSGTAAAKALLGLNEIPPEVSDEPSENVIEGTAEAPVRINALQLFKDAETLEALEAAWDAVLGDYSESNEQIPPDVEDAYKAAKAAFNEPAHSGE